MISLSEIQAWRLDGIKPYLEMGAVMITIKQKLKQILTKGSRIGSWMFALMGFLIMATIPDRLGWWGEPYSTTSSYIGAPITFVIGSAAVVFLIATILEYLHRRLKRWAGQPKEVKPMAENSPETRESQELQGRIQKALELAVRYGGIDGDHHKAWVIDQMVRELTGCPTVQRESPYPDAQGNKYTSDTLGESEEYLELVREAREGDDGPETYDWNTGIAP